MHRSSMEKMRQFRDSFLNGRERESLKIVDLGSRDVNGTYRMIFDSPRWKYIGVDMESGSNVDIVITDPYHWKEIEADSVDVAISGQAFEHIEFFWLTMLQIERVLKPGGLCCIIAPSSGYEHKYPVDCWRFYPDGFSALARYACLDILDCYAQRTARDHADESDVWQDCVLIARKRYLPPIARAKIVLRRYLLRIIH